MEGRVGGRDGQMEGNNVGCVRLESEGRKLRMRELKEEREG